MVRSTWPVFIMTCVVARPTFFLKPCHDMIAVVVLSGSGQCYGGHYVVRGVREGGN